jgi:hypothetical protein
LSAKLLSTFAKEGDMWLAWWIPTAVFSVSLARSSYFFSFKLLFVLTRLSGHRSKVTTSQEIW